MRGRCHTLNCNLRAVTFPHSGWNCVLLPGRRPSHPPWNRHTACSLWSARRRTHCGCTVPWRRWAAGQCAACRGSALRRRWCIPIPTPGTPVPLPRRRPAGAAGRRTRRRSDRPGPSAGQTVESLIITRTFPRATDGETGSKSVFAPLWAWCHCSWWCCCTRGGETKVGEALLAPCPRRWSGSSLLPLSSFCLLCRNKRVNQSASCKRLNCSS